jgi:hypothetical protein
MQKVVGSSPIIRFKKTPQMRGFLHGPGAVATKLPLSEQSGLGAGSHSEAGPISSIRRRQLRHGGQDGPMGDDVGGEPDPVRDVAETTQSAGR